MTTPEKTLKQVRTFCGEVQRLGVELLGNSDQQVNALAELQNLHSEALQHMDWCAENERYLEPLQLVAYLARFWWMRGLGATVHERIEALLSGPLAEPPSALAAAYMGAAELSYARASYATARAEYERAIELFCNVEDRVGQARAMNGLGMVEREQAHYPQARRLHERALQLFEGEGHEWGRAHALNNLGVVAFRLGTLDEAVELHERALEIRRTIDDLHGIASSLGNLALVHRARGAHALARPLYLESARARERLGDIWGIAGSSVCLSVVETRLGNTEAAQLHLRAAVEGFAAVNDALGLAESAEAALELFIRAEEPQKAKSAFAISEAIRRSLGAPLSEAERTALIRHTKSIEEALGEQALDEDRDWAAKASLAAARTRLKELIQ